MANNVGWQITSGIIQGRFAANREYGLEARRFLFAVDHRDLDAREPGCLQKLGQLDRGEVLGRTPTEF
jgi:hypothetical protein